MVLTVLSQWDILDNYTRVCSHIHVKGYLKKRDFFFSRSRSRSRNNVEHKHFLENNGSVTLCSRTCGSISIVMLCSKSLLITQPIRKEEVKQTLGGEKDSDIWRRVQFCIPWPHVLVYEHSSIATAVTEETDQFKNASVRTSSLLILTAPII